MNIKELEKVAKELTKSFEESGSEVIKALEELTSSVESMEKGSIPNTDTDSFAEFFADVVNSVALDMKETEENEEETEMEELIVMGKKVMTDEEVAKLSDKELVEKVSEWAVDRNLSTAEPKKQFLKLTEESGEIAKAYAEGDVEEFRDAVGDTMVVLTVLSLQLDLDPVKVLGDAVGKAKRKVKESGMFTTWNIYDNMSPATYEEHNILLSIVLSKMSSELARDNHDKLGDIIHDTAIIISHMSFTVLHESPIEGYREAYNVIKMRGGKLVDGVFVKEEDL